MTVKLLTEHHLEFLSSSGSYTGSSESTLVKMPNCCKSHVAAHIFGSLIHVNVAHQIGISTVFTDVRTFYHTYLIPTCGKDKNQTVTRRFASNAIVM